VDPGFQVGDGAHLKKLLRAEGGTKIVGVFRMKNHDFMPFFLFFPPNFRGGGTCQVRLPLPAIITYAYTMYMEYEYKNGT
jgi:hypothetical protein